jgi:hypothetical protein
LVYCPEVMRAIAESMPFLVTVAFGMVVIVGREAALTARARGWRIPSAVLRHAPRNDPSPTARRLEAF